ncbi:MAG: hypothetical protein HY222_03870 [Thaumarchaeota archaeon]|nr:hypothetical protein [Nitrososphaerota archaeon]MBI3641512.1 hypothetical protein [Nitrososphaerota archaeon]
MPDYVIKGSIKDTNGNAIKNIKIQAMDSDQEFFEDRNDDILGNVWGNNDGTFEISFDKTQFQNGWLEGNPDIYLMIRNLLGEVIYTTETRRGVKSSDKKNLTFDIVLDSLEKKITFPDDPYSSNMNKLQDHFKRLGYTGIENTSIKSSISRFNNFPDNTYSNNMNRVEANFQTLGESADLTPKDFARTFSLLMDTIDGWMIYTRPEIWEMIGYDGPQVPRYPWKEKHTHKLGWDKK